VRDISSPNLTGLAPFEFETRRYDKPWGHEVLWACSESYCGKLLYMRAGEQLSLQFHNVKDETIYVHEGRIELEMGAPGDAVRESEIVAAGSAYRIKPGTVHRWRALEDSTVLEVSSPEIDDVVRLEDRYGRAG
jgi:mannose-6-phosphate isomerase-like protein (cupin superfamily)